MYAVCFNLLINPRLGQGERTPMEQSVASEAQAQGTMAAPLAHQSSFVSCQGSGYQTPDTGPSSHRSSSGTSSPARASVLSSSSSTGSVDSADAAVVIEPEINIMLCDDVMDYADVQSMSDEQEEPITLKATKGQEGVTAVSCDAWIPFISCIKLNFCEANDTQHGGTVRLADRRLLGTKAHFTGLSTIGAESWWTGGQYADAGATSGGICHRHRCKCDQLG